MKHSPFFKLIFIISLLFCGIQMNAVVRYVCPDIYNYYCPDDPVIVLHNLGSLPPGGTFYLNAAVARIPISQVDPSQYPNGTSLSIDYENIEYKFNCSFYIIIYAYPDVRCPKLLQYCWSLKTIYIDNSDYFTPNGGTFSGDHITGTGIFDRASAGPGNHVVTYTYTNPQTGCSSSCQTTIQLTNNEIENCPRSAVGLCYSPEINLPEEVGILPAGGVYSGDYVSGNILKPPKAGVYNITYIWEGLQGCDGICHFEVVLDTIPDFPCPEDMLICGFDGGSFALPYPTDHGWKYEGVGVIKDGPIYYFDPQRAGVGTHKITLTVYSLLGCEEVCIFYITVSDLSADCPEYMIVCSDSKTDLNKLWNFNQGGIFSGELVDSSGIFSAPIVYEEEYSTVEYTFEDEYGCSVSCVFKVYIVPYPRIECPDTIEACLGDTTLIMIPNAPGGHFYLGDKEIPNVLNPANLGAGTYDITYNYVYSEKPYCVFTCKFVLIIYPEPKLECPNDTIVCLTDKLIYLPVPDYPEWGYSGLGVYNIDGKPVFNPQKAGVGKHTITLTIIDENGCTASCNFTITVVDFNIECPREIVVCPGVKTDLKTKWNFNPKGTFEGDYVSSDGIFEAPMIYESKCYDITYFLTNELGCKDSCLIKICVLAAPYFDCPDTVYLCINSGIYLPKIDFRYKFYWNNKEIPNGFNPATAGIGTHHVKIIYTSTSNQMECSFTCEFVIVVVPMPKWECPDDMTLCSFGQVITLPTLPFPEYNYHGTGVFSQGGPYYFSAPKPGKYVITASITDKYGCDDSCSFTISVGEFKLECPKTLKVCPDVKTDLKTLWNFDPHGEFFGEWVTTDGIFNAPYIPGKNNCYIIKYRIFIDENCQDSCRFVVCVNYVPEVRCPDTMEVCINERPFNPAAGTNATVYFNGKPIPNGFNPAEAGAGTHILTFEFYNEKTDCKSYCQMVIIVHPLPKLDCPDDIYLCNPETAIELPTFEFPFFEYKGRGIYFEHRKAHFKAPNGRPGSYIICLYVKDEFGCTNSCCFKIIVGDIHVNCPEYLTVCPGVTTDLTTLWNFHPNGIFIGPFVDAEGNFNAPEVTGQTECFPIMFILKTNDGCVDSCVFKVCVKPLPQIQCPDTIHVCINDEPFNPMPGAPGTIFFNDKPIPNGFNPQEAGVGTHYLTYIYHFSERPACEYICKFVIVVHALPEIECPNNMLICSKGEKIVLPVQPYSEYIYQGDGVIHDAGIYYFDSNLAGSGSHVIMLVVYDKWGCKNICRFTIFVGDSQIECPDTLWICAGTKGDLNRLWNFPYNGTFSGTGVTPDGIFYADEIMEKQCVDIYYYYYKYKCKDSCQFTVCVEPKPDIECPDTMHVCINANPFIPIPNAPGTFYFRGKPLPNGYFNPIAYSEGTYTITYVEYYGHNRECIFTCDIIIVIHSRLKLECPQDILICNKNIEKINLPDLPYPYYEYTGDHVEGEPLSQVFNVAEAGIGIHFISLAVKDEWGCIGSCRFRIVVGGEKIQCPDTLFLCPGDKYPLTRLTNFPGGGYFISNLVSNNWFYAPVSDVDKCYNIKYVLKDKFGCLDSCNFVICVQGKTEIDCPDTIKVCEDGKAFIPEIKPSGGSFKTVDGAELPGGWFDPAEYGPGNYTIYYHYTTAAPYFCTLGCTFVIQVVPKPRIECPKEIRLCMGDKPLVLTNLLWPHGGTYTTIDGVIITTFYPKEPGKQIITYHYTDPKTGCTAICEFVIVVFPLPEVKCPNDTSVCAVKGIYELGGGEPAGGVYHENGTAISHIHTDIPGVHKIWYVFTDRYTGCSDSCSYNVYVLAKPQIDCPEKISVCSEEKLNLLGYVTKPSSEMYHYWFSGQGLSGAHNEIFESYSLPQGEYLITYTVGVGNCIDSCSFWIVVLHSPIKLNCPDDMTVCASAGGVNITALLNPTGAVIENYKIKIQTVTHTITPGSTLMFIPGSISPADYNKPIEITATSCSYYNNGKDTCCSSCTFHITVTDHANVDCTGNIFACAGTASIDLSNYVSPDGGEFYYHGNLVNSNFNLANLPSLQDIPIIYYFPKRGVDCADSCTLTLKILPAPVISLRDTIWPGNVLLNINNNSVAYASLFHWYSDGDGTFDNPAILHPAYNPGIIDFHRGKVVLHLAAQNESCEAKASMVAYAAQKLDFPAKWGGVSLYRDPVNDNLEQIVEPIKNDLNLIYNLNGDRYVPLKSVLTTWETQSGYIANCTNGSSLLVAGSYNSGQPLYVNAGWNLIPVLSSCPADIEILTLNGNLKIAKEVAGLNVYWPEANVLDLTQLIPGKSYLANFEGSETIIFPSCDPIVLASNKSVTTDPFIPEGWGILHKTPASFVVALPADHFTSAGITDGDVIGAFTPEGILGGICEIGLNNSLVLFGNDPLTNEKDGFDDCDPVTLKLFKRSTGEIFSIDPTVIGEGSLECFKENGYLQIGEVVLTDVNSLEKPKFLVYPNPANHFLNVVNPVEKVTCTVYNVTGQILINQQLEHGINRLTVQLLRDGIYIIQFKNQNFNESKRFIKQ
jgi:hypothetical protein